MKRKMSLYRAGLGMAFIACALLYLDCSDALLDEMKDLAAEASRPSILPADGATITAHETITLVFKTGMAPSDVSVSGTMGNESATWGTTSTTNDTLVLNAASAVAWNSGSAMKLVVTVNEGGESSVHEFSYTVFNGTCVNGTAGKGDDSNPGTILAPVATVQKGIEKAHFLYAPFASEVRIAPNSTFGKYSANSNTGSPVATMVEGVSLYGGYSQDYSVRDTTTYETILVDSATTGGTAPFGTMSPSAQPNHAVFFPAGITSSTVLDGFTVMPGAGKNNAAITCCDSSPVISNIKVRGASSAITGDTDVYVIGIYVFNENGKTIAASPLVTACDINPGWTGWGTYNCWAIGVCLFECAAPVIQDCTIKGGGGDITCGIYCKTGRYQSVNTMIRRNSIDCGAGTGSGGAFHFCIYFEETDMVEVGANILSNASSASIAYGICESLSTGYCNAYSVHDNVFHTSVGSFTLYWDNATTKVTNLTTAISTGEGNGTLGSWNNTVN